MSSIWYPVPWLGYGMGCSHGSEPIFVHEFTSTPDAVSFLEPVLCSP